MPDGAKLATAYYELIPSMAGAQEKIASQLAPAAAGAGTAGGAALGGSLLVGLKKFAGPIAVLAAGFSIKKIVGDSTEAFEKLAGSVNSLQRIAGGTKEQVSGLQGALQLSGVDSTKATASLTIFAKQLGKAQGDSKATADLTKKLGTSFTDAAGNIKPMSDILPGVADKFKSLPDGAEKTALAVQLFGRSGTQLLPFLNKGSAGIADLTAKAASMGLVIDDVSAKTFANARVSARNYAASIQGLQVTLGGALLPVLDGVQNIFRNALTPAIMAVTGLIAKNRDSFVDAGEKIDAFATKVGTVSSAIFGFLSSGSKTDLATALGVGTDSGVVAALSGIRGAFESTIGAIKGILGGFSGSFTSILGIAGAAFGPLNGLLGGFITKLPVIGGLFGGLSGPLSLISGPFGIIAGLIGSLVATSPALRSELGGALAGIGSAIQPLLSALGGTLTSVVGLLASTFSVLASTVAGALTTALVAIIPPIANMASLLVGSLSGAVVGLLPLVLNLVTTLSGTFSKILLALVPVITSLATVLAGVLTSSLSALLPVITQVITILTQTFATALTSLLPVIVQLAPIVGQIASTLGTVLGTVLKALVPIIVLVAQVFGQVLTSVAPLIPTIFSLVTPILGLVAPLLQLIAPLLQLVGPILVPLIQLFTQLLTPILGLITPLVGLLVPAIQLVVQVLAILVTGIVQGLSFFVQLVTGSKSAQAGVSAAWGAIGSFFSRIWSDITGFFTGGISNIVNAVSGIKSKIVDTLKDVGTAALDGGKKIVQGIIDGITSKISDAKDAIKGVVGAIANFLPHSPAKEGPLSGRGYTTYSGQALTADFAKGIVSGTDGVQTAMAALTTMPQVASLNASLSSSSLTAAGGSSFPDTVTLLDADGSLIARTKVIAQDAVAANARAKGLSLSTGTQRR